MKSNKMGIHSGRSTSGFPDSLFGIRKSALHDEITLTETAYADSTAKDALVKLEEAKTWAFDWIRKLQNR